MNNETETTLNDLKKIEAKIREICHFILAEKSLSSQELLKVNGIYHLFLFYANKIQEFFLDKEKAKHKLENPDIYDPFPPRSREKLYLNIFPAKKDTLEGIIKSSTEVIDRLSAKHFLYLSALIQEEIKQVCPETSLKINYNKILVEGKNPQYGLIEILVYPDSLTGKIRCRNSKNQLIIDRTIVLPKGIKEGIKEWIEHQ